MSRDPCLATRPQHRCHVLKGPFGIPSHDHAQAAVFLPDGSQPLRQFGHRDEITVQRDATVAVNVDDAFLRCRGQRSVLSDLGHFQIQLALPFRELRARHEENDQQEHDVDHRRQVQSGLFVLMSFEWHGGNARVALLPVWVRRPCCVLRPRLRLSFGRNQVHDLLAQRIDQDDQAIHAADEIQVGDQCGDGHEQSRGGGQQCLGNPARQQFGSAHGPAFERSR